MRLPIRITFDAMWLSPVRVHTSFEALRDLQRRSAIGVKSPADDGTAGESDICQDLLELCSASTSERSRDADESPVVIRRQRILVDERRIARSALWSDKRPNQSPEPTVMLVTPRADARVAPSTTVARL
jgi:hypothetical protein